VFLYISLSSALLGFYGSTSNSVIAQTKYNDISSEVGGRENFLAPMEQSFQDKLDPKVVDKIEQGAKEVEDALKENGKQLFITALPFLPTNNVKGNSRALDNEVASPPSAPPSTVNWEGNVRVSGRAGIQTEPDIISSEINDGNLVAAVTDYSSGSVLCRLASSTDAGVSWIDRGNMQVPPGTSFLGDPALATNSKGHFIATCLAWDTDANGDPTSSAIIMQVSKDKGATWSSPTLVIGSTSDISPIFHDKPWIASDPNVHSPWRDRTYMCWTKFDDPI
jgi:hypothetical protein